MLQGFYRLIFLLLGFGNIVHSTHIIMSDSKAKLPPLSDKDRATLLDLVDDSSKDLFSIDKKSDAVKRKTAAWEKVILKSCKVSKSNIDPKLN